MSLIYTSCLYNIFRSNIHFDTDSFKMMLVSPSYRPSKDHSKRSDIKDEIPSGGGYIQGGLDVDVTVRSNVENSRVDISLGKATWTNSTIEAAGAIYYRMSGGGPSSDDLICFVQFMNDTRSENGSFTVSQSILRAQN